MKKKIVTLPLDIEDFKKMAHKMRQMEEVAATLNNLGKFIFLLGFRSWCLLASSWLFAVLWLVAGLLVFWFFVVLACCL